MEELVDHFNNDQPQKAKISLDANGFTHPEVEALGSETKRDEAYRPNIILNFETIQNDARNFTEKRHEECELNIDSAHTKERKSNIMML
jgi:hypothetical protein